MNDLTEIITYAQELGKKIGAHSRCANFMAAARAVAADQTAQNLLKAYEDQASRVQDLEAASSPIEPQDKRQLADLQSQVAGNDKLKNMFRHQANYLEMMNRVMQAIDGASRTAAEP